MLGALVVAVTAADTVLLSWQRDCDAHAHTLVAAGPARQICP